MTMPHAHKNGSHAHTEDSGGCDGHDHSSAVAASASKMALAVGLTLAFVVGEAVVGYFANSLALLSDAGHNLADAAALGLSWYALWIMKKPSNPKMTFGYHRVGILAAFVNSVSLFVIAIFILWEAVERLRHPEPVQGWPMVVAAGIAIVVNVIISTWLHHGAKHDLNVRSAYLHMIGDAVSAFGVVLAGIVVIVTHAHVADPVVSFLIAALILWSGWGVLKQSLNILLEGSPAGLDMTQVENSIKTVPGVLGAHDVHVWTVGPGVLACSVHVIVADQTTRQGQEILKLVVVVLKERFGINHTTVQVEVEGDEKDELYCTLQPAGGSSHFGHNH